MAVLADLLGHIVHFRDQRIDFLVMPPFLGAYD
jgi:hypothetical protein